MMMMMMMTCKLTAVGETGLRGSLAAHRVAKVPSRDTEDVTVHIHSMEVVNVSEPTPIEDLVNWPCARVTSFHPYISPNTSGYNAIVRKETPVPTSNL